jgi:hypothetical protein
MTIKASDTQTLDLLALPASIDIRLQRRINYFDDARHVLNGTQNHALRKTEVRDVQTAVWWAVLDGDSSDPLERSFQGEIHISNGLQPSSDFLLFSIEVSFISRSVLRGA